MLTDLKLNITFIISRLVDHFEWNMSILISIKIWSSAIFGVVRLGVVELLFGVGFFYHFEGVAIYLLEFYVIDGDANIALGI